MIRIHRVAAAVVLALLALPAAVVLALLALPAAARQVPSAELVTELRVHGNYSIPDADVMRLAGVATGDRIESETLALIAARLRASNRFEDVEVRKRYTSLIRSDEVALILVVRERPSPVVGTRVPAC